MIEKKEKSFEKRQELIEIAIMEFSEKGYEKASLNKILKKVGISKGTFYYHFRNKEELYMYLIEVLIEKKKDFFTSNVNMLEIGKDFFSQLKSMSKMGIQFAKENVYIGKFSESFMKEKGNEIYRKALKRYNFKDNDNYVKLMVNNGIGSGEIRSDIPSGFVSNVVGYILTNIVEIAEISDIKDYEVSIKYLFEFLENGLKNNK